MEIEDTLMRPNVICGHGTEANLSTLNLVCIILHTQQGVIVHSGDFKLDLTPVDNRRTDLARLGELSSTVGIRLLMCDSTNAEEQGHAPSERSVGTVLKALFAQQRGRRVITASFASHIHRIQQIIEAAVDDGRVVATLGLSMKKIGRAHV